MHGISAFLLALSVLLTPLEASAVGGARSFLHRAAQLSTDEPSPLSRGSRARIFGLQHAVELNGREGTVAGFDQPTGRYVLLVPGIAAPQKVRLEHLELLAPGGAPEPAGAEAEPPQEAEAQGAEAQGPEAEAQGAEAAAPPPPLANGAPAARGEHVVLDGLVSMKALNGHEGIIRGFDGNTGRYIVEIPGEQPRRIKPANLVGMGRGGTPDNVPHAQVANGQAKASICQRAQTDSHRDDGPAGLKPGTQVTLHGLTSAAAVAGSWNGQVAEVHCFDTATQRYVVAMPDGTPRRIRPEHLQPKGVAAPSATDSAGTAPVQAAPAVEATPIATAGAAAVHALTAVAAAANPVAAAGAAVANAMAAAATAVAAPPPPGSKAPERAKVAVEASPSTTVPAAPKAQPGASRNASVSSERSAAWPTGSQAQLVGLHAAAALNGKVGVIRGFDNSTQRYVVEVAKGVLKWVKAEHLAAVPAAGSLGSAADGNAEAPATPRLTVCNAYAPHSPLEVFFLPKNKSSDKKYAQVFHHLEFQSCADVPHLPEEAGTFSFVAGRLEVARTPLDSTKLGHHGAEFIVYRNDVNSLKAKVHQNLVELGDEHAYYLHVVNAYAGSRLLQLKVRRGAFTKQLALDKTYRLSRNEAIELILTDGFQKLDMGFQPQHSKTYTVVMTGADPGLRGEPSNVGLVAHELGAWTTREEMTDEAEVSKQSGPGQQAAAEAMPVAPQDLPTDAPQASQQDVNREDSVGALLSSLTSRLSW